MGNTSIEIDFRAKCSECGKDLDFELDYSSYELEWRIWVAGINGHDCNQGE